MGDISAEGTGVVELGGEGLGEDVKTEVEGSCVDAGGGVGPTRISQTTPTKPSGHTHPKTPVPVVTQTPPFLTSHYRSGVSTF